MFLKNKSSLYQFLLFSIIFSNIFSLSKINSEELKTQYKDTNPWQVLDEKKDFSYGMSVGSFIRGASISDFFNDTSNFTNIFGFIGSFDFNKKITTVKNINIFLDSSFEFGSQNIMNSAYSTVPKKYQKKQFLLFSLIPTIRARLPYSLKNISLGTGVGLSYSLGNVPTYEYPHNIPLMTAVKFEIAYQPKPNSNFEFIFDWRHRCALFGLLNQKDDSNPQTQWVNFGIRKWL